MHTIVDDDIVIMLSDMGKLLPSFDGKNIYITGVTGQIGEYLLRLFKKILEKEINVRIWGIARDKRKIDLLYEQLELPRQYFNLFDADVTNIKEIGSKLNGVRIDYCILAASPTAANDYDTLPVSVVEANIIGTYYLLSEMKEQNKKPRIVFVSSSSVYGEVEKEFVDEHCFGALDPLAARACYSESKRATETLIKAFSTQYGYDYSIVRSSRIIGPYITRGKSFLSQLFSIIAKRDGSILEVFYSDSEIQPIYITDVISSIIFAMLCEEKRTIFNVSGGTKVSIDDVINMINRNIGGRIKYVDADVIIGGRKIKTNHTNAILDNSKLCKMGWRLRYSGEESIQRVIDFLLQFH